MTTKSRIQKLRRILRRNGYELVKKHRGEDSWMILQYLFGNTGVYVAGYDDNMWTLGLTLDEVEEWIAELEQELNQE